jgi:hypothetical protein
MAYLKINKERYEFLLRFGAGDDELRRFFSENRTLLIMKGAKVQNLPRGPQARITTMLNLSSGTDPIVHKWFSTNLTMIDPVSVEELLETFRLYEEADENLPEGEEKRLFRSCLIHLFSSAPPPELVDFLKTRIGGNGLEPDHEPVPDKEIMPQQSPTGTGQALLDAGFASALVALLEGKDPDEHLADMSPAIASFITGLYAIKEGHAEEAKNALEDLGKCEQVESILSEYAERQAKIKQSSKPAASGIKIFTFEEADNPKFDIDRDQIIGKCTKDTPESAVFIQPFAIRTWDGKLLSLEEQATRETLFPMSGDVQAFHGRGYPRQPTRGEIGIWHIVPNETHGSASHRNNFHLKNSAKTDVFEVHLVPFGSTDYDSVRGYIREQMIKAGNKQLEPCLFLLRDDLIVGCPSGKDLTKDEGFHEGLPCWRALSAFRFEGRILVPGPLPAHEQYECATLASTLKTFFTSNRADSEKLTRAQQKYLLDRVNSGEGHLNAARQARLFEELRYLENDDEAIGLILNEAMNDSKIAARIEQQIQEIVDEETGKKSELKKELEQLEKQREVLRENIAKQVREQRALPTSVTRAIKDSFKKAKADGFETLGQVVVFKALMEKLDCPHNPGQVIPNDLSSSDFRMAAHDASSFLDFLKSLGLSSKHAKALELTGDVVFSAGMILVIEGIAARLAAEAWGRKDEYGCMLVDCTIGWTEVRQMMSLAGNEIHSVVILDANLSPPDVYARPLLDRVQRRIVSHEHTRSPRILMSLSDSVASLPLPSKIEALAVRISLDDKLEFIHEEDVVAELEDVQDEDAGETWASRLWNPALNALLQCLKSMPAENAALVLSVLKAESA